MVTAQILDSGSKDRLVGGLDRREGHNQTNASLAREAKISPEVASVALSTKRGGQNQGRHVLRRYGFE